MSAESRRAAAIDVAHAVDRIGRKDLEKKYGKVDVLSAARSLASFVKEELQPAASGPIGWQIVRLDRDDPPPGMATYEIYSLAFVLAWPDRQQPQPGTVAAVAGLAGRHRRRRGPHARRIRARPRQTGGRPMTDDTRPLVEQAKARLRREDDEQYVEELTRRTADRLDAMTALFDRVEKKLKAMRPVYDVGVEFSIPGDDRTHVLAMVKGEQWRLVHTCTGGKDPALQMPQVPIIDCSAAIRIAAGKHVRALHEAILFQREGFVAELDAAIAGLIETLKEMG